tara:strand:- start:28 stop:852 length:825 start_codon:yes stop_codon:yes gene_type:complete
MAYLGTKPQSGFISQEANQYFTGLTQNYIDLNQSINSLSSVIILVNGVVQENSTLTLTTSSRITLGATLVASDKVTCIYLAKISSTQAPSTGSVTSDMLAGSIANSKLANSSVSINGSSVSLGGSLTGIGESNTPYFKVHTASSTQQVNSGAYLDPVVFGTELFDSDSAVASNVFTVPSGKAGKYFFNAQIEFYQNMYDVYLLLVKNSTNTAFARNKRQSDSSLWNMRTVQVSSIIDMAVGDTMKVKVYAETSDAQYNIFAAVNNIFEGFRIAT